MHSYCSPTTVFQHVSQPHHCRHADQNRSICFVLVAQGLSATQGGQTDTTVIHAHIETPSLRQVREEHCCRETSARAALPALRRGQAPESLLSGSEGHPHEAAEHLAALAGQAGRSLVTGVPQSLTQPLKRSTELMELIHPQHGAVAEPNNHFRNTTLPITQSLVLLSLQTMKINSKLHDTPKPMPECKYSSWRSLCQCHTEKPTDWMRAADFK